MSEGYVRVMLAGAVACPRGQRHRKDAKDAKIREGKMPMRADYVSDAEEEIGRAVVHAAFTVHRRLGPGLLESVYETCFCYELQKAGLSAERQAKVPLVYDDLTFDVGFRLDVLVHDRVICELKSVETIHPISRAQILTHLRLCDKRLGFLINFNVPLIKDGIERFVLAPSSS